MLERVGPWSLFRMLEAGSLAVKAESASATFIIRAATHLSLDGPADLSVYGQPVTFTAGVSNGIGDPPAGELVTFSEGDTTLGSGRLDASGQASFTATQLPAGAHTITATYAGDDDFAGSSGELGLVVLKADQTITFPTITFGPLVVPNPSAGSDWHEIVRLRDETRAIIARNSGEPLL